jgi:peroxiredoxin
MMNSKLRNSLVTATLVCGVIVGGGNFFQPTESDRQVAIAAGEVKIGAPAPNFTGTDSNGKKHNFADFKGKTVVLEWTNNDCPSVRKHYETKNMQKIQKSATSQGVIWLTIVSSAPGEQGFVNGEKANELTKSRAASPTAVILDPDGKIGRTYGARTTPHLFVINPKGNLVYMGAIDDKPTTDKADVPIAKNYVVEALDAVKAGKAVTTATSQPYGCSVKYGK